MPSNLCYIVGLVALWVYYGARYVQQPHGFDDGTERVCKLNRAIYNLWQAFRAIACFRTLSEFPKIYRLRICQADDIVFFNEDGLRTPYRSRSMWMAYYGVEGQRADSTHTATPATHWYLPKLVKVLSRILVVQLSFSATNHVTTTQRYSNSFEI